MVLPEHIAEKYPLDMLEPILIHELAHIRQRDHLINAFQHLVGIGLFFHPLYWLICRRLGSEREVKAKGLSRLEGRDYIVQDGDILNIRFGV